MKHIQILGKLESKFHADFDNENVEIWSMNKHVDANMLPRVDKWFDLHIQPSIDAHYTKQNFPFEKCHELVGRRFVTTAAYMIAFAIVEGATEISLFGMRFTNDGNPRRQRELHNVRELIFYALGRGVKINIYSEDKPYLFPEHIVDDSEDFDQ